MWRFKGRAIHQTILLSLLVTSVFSLAAAQSSESSTSGLTVIESRDPGSYIADSKGMTLYTLVDKNMKALSCGAECLKSWPAYTGDAALAKGESQVASTVDASLLGDVESKDGLSQVTYNDYPLYYFMGDTKPGDLNGQGCKSLGGHWYVVSNKGEPIESESMMMN